MMGNTSPDEQYFDEKCSAPTECKSFPYVEEIKHLKAAASINEEHIIKLRDQLFGPAPAEVAKDCDESSLILDWIIEVAERLDKNNDRLAEISASIHEKTGNLTL